MSRVLRWLMPLIMSACTGLIGGSSGQGKEVITPEAQRTSLPTQQFSLISSRQFANSIEDLLGVTDLPKRTSGGAAPQEFLSKESTRLTPDTYYELQSIAEAASEKATVNLDALLKCDAASSEKDCALRFAVSLAKRAFKRAVTESDKAAFLRVYEASLTDGGTPRDGVRGVIEAVLLAPSFLHRKETGTEVTSNTAVLDSHEVASVLSFFLLDAVPDTDLAAAAESGALTTDAQIQAQVERLLKEPRAQKRLSERFLRWLSVPKLATATHTDAAFTDALSLALQTETRLFIDDWLWHGSQNISDLLTTGDSFIDPSLAAFYGVTYPSNSNGSGFLKTTFPPEKRVGVLTQGSWLSAHAGVSDTSVVHRGLFVIRDLLCTNIAQPPPDLATIISSSGSATMTERERAIQRMNDTRCGSCHRNIDPAGLAFENFDVLGRYRTTDSKGNIDTTWESLPIDGQAAPVNGVSDLMRRVAGSAALSDCMAKTFAGQALGRPLTAGEDTTLGHARAAFDATQGNMVELIRQIARWPGLRERRIAQ